MEILIWGVVLLVLGLAGTLVYDKYKANILQALMERNNRVSVSTSKKKSQEEVLKELLKPRAPVKPSDFSIENHEMTIQELIAKIEAMKRKS